MLERRGFLRRMMAVPLLARQAGEEVGKQLAGIGSDSFPRQSLRNELRAARDHEGAAVALNPASGQTGGRDWLSLRKLRDDMILDALNTPKKRAELEPILYQLHRRIYALDPDLAFNRSISPAAKVVFQRQRNVARDVEHTIQEKTAHEGLREWKRKILSVAGIDL